MKKICANLTEMTPINLNHFSFNNKIKAVQLKVIMPNSHICKSKFHVSYHFLDIYKNTKRKKLY